MTDGGRADDADRRLPYSIDFRRGEVELLDPSLYLACDAPPFVDSHVRGPGGDELVAADLDDYLEWYEPLAGEHRAQPLLHIFMVNRCGSTLLLNALCRLRGVAGFNELDPWSTSTAPEWAHFVDRVDEAIGGHLRLWSARTGRRVVLKHRGEMMLAAPRLLGLFPGSRAVFVLRDYRHVIGSHLAGAPSSFPGGVLGELAERSPSLLRWRPALPAEMHAAFYVDTIAQYRALAAGALGPSIRALRYETLVRKPAAALHAVASHFGLELDDATLAAALGEFDHDAKARAQGKRAAFVASAYPPLELAGPIAEELERACSEPLPGELAVTEPD